MIEENSNIEESNHYYNYQVASAPIYYEIPNHLKLNRNNLVDYLVQQNWPEPLIEHFIQHLSSIPLRYYVYDDSGSMRTKDGHKKIPNVNKYISCTRWEELCETIHFQFTTSYQGNIQSKFYFLNNKKVYDIANHLNYNDTIIEMINMEGGGTPLCETINQIANDIELYKSELFILKKKVIVFIATDGESSDGDITIPLQRLKNLPVHIVLKLCTNDQVILTYWNEIDKNLELNLDVIDDYFSEANEIYDINPNICYSTCLHQYREFGTKIAEFDLLDEMKLSYEQLCSIATIIYGHTFLSRNMNDNNQIIQNLQQNKNVLLPWCVVTNKHRSYITFPDYRNPPTSQPKLKDNKTFCHIL